MSSWKFKLLCISAVLACSAAAGAQAASGTVPAAKAVRAAEATGAAQSPVAASSAQETIRLSAAQVSAAGIKVVAAQAASADEQASPRTTGLRLMGQVVAPGNDTGVVLSAVAGQLELVYVHIGATIHAGDPLARVYSAELASMQREYLHARASAELAEARLSRDEALFKEGIIAEARLREARAAREMALATRQEQRRLLKLAGYSEAEIDSLTANSISSSVTLRARTSGVVLEQPAQAGQHVEAGTTLFKLAPPGKWWLELEASRAQASDIHIGDRVRVEGCRVPGRVIAVGSQLRTASQTLPVRAEIPDAASCLRPNQYIEADVLRGAAAGLVSVPASAVVRNGNGEFVFVERGGEFRPTQVVVARREGGQALLREGIEPGVRVASSGLVALKGAWLGLGPQPDTPGAR